MITGAPIDVVRGSWWWKITMPSVGAIITVPEPFVNTVRGRRLHLRVMRLAIAETLRWHNKKIMPGHFRQTNRSKYQHKDRTRRWKAYKKIRYRSITDLSASRKSEDRFKAPPRVAFAGSSEGSVHAYMRYQWPFPKVGMPNPKRVTIYDMNSEVTRWTNEEIQESAKIFQQHFVRIYLQEIKNQPKLKRIIAPQLKL